MDVSGIKRAEEFPFGDDECVCHYADEYIAALERGVGKRERMTYGLALRQAARCLNNVKYFDFIEWYYLEGGWRNADEHDLELD